MTLTLESWLRESANILRGPVDAADFKTYIFPLLFFKRICDVWDEEYSEIVAETGDATPTRAQIEDRLYEQELGMLSRRYLRDLRRDSAIITR